MLIITLIQSERYSLALLVAIFSIYPTYTQTRHSNNLARTAVTDLQILHPGPCLQSTRPDLLPHLAPLVPKSRRQESCETRLVMDVESVL